MRSKDKKLKWLALASALGDLGSASPHPGIANWANNTRQRIGQQAGAIEAEKAAEKAKKQQRKKMIGSLAGMVIGGGLGGFAAPALAGAGGAAGAGAGAAGAAGGGFGLSGMFSGANMGSQIGGALAGGEPIPAQAITQGAQMMLPNSGWGGGWGGGSPGIAPNAGIDPVNMQAPVFQTNSPLVPHDPGRQYIYQDPPRWVYENPYGNNV